MRWGGETCIGARGAFLAFSLLVASVGEKADAAEWRDLFAESRFSAQVQADVQYSFKDETALSSEYDNRFMSHLYLDGAYDSKMLSVGVRFEMYENPLPGFEEAFKGYGLPYFYLTLNLKTVSVTAGDFYEQFGSGLVLRAYQERSLGIDNALRGGRVVYTPLAGLRVKALAGLPRSRWEWSRGVVWGTDAELDIEEWIAPMRNAGHAFQLAGSFVSKHEEDELIVIAPGKRLNLPLNVGAFSARANYRWKGFSLMSEYAWKANDPSSDNRFIYRPGQALLLSTSFSLPGFGVTLAAKHSDNMSFRSHRMASENLYSINYQPAFSRQHTYALASLYPYATQMGGEVAFQADLFYKVKRNSWLGGRYGMDVRLNFSQINALRKEYPSGVLMEGTYGYRTHLFAVGEELYYRDFNIEVSRKMNADLKLTLMYMNQSFNEVVTGKLGLVFSNIYVAEMQYRLSKACSLRMELQYLFTEQDDKDWAAVVAELSVTPQWIFTLSNLWNRGTGKHYPFAAAAFVVGTHRIQLSGGRQREGYNCAGGVCRYVPGTTGVALSYTANF